ncbi:hypothetical protein [Sphaerisporangium sp. NPDC051011]|uniref:hypothetical protein n=1 Tax=Sphaerisporangium sp. NPDC051011 TaxID=3155792 RepID=UPI00340C5A12
MPAEEIEVEGQLFIGCSLRASVRHFGLYLGKSVMVGEGPRHIQASLAKAAKQAIFT